MHAMCVSARRSGGMCRACRASCVPLAVRLAQSPESQRAKGVGGMGVGEGKRGRGRGKEHGLFRGLRCYMTATAGQMPHFCPSPEQLCIINEHTKMAPKRALNAFQILASQASSARNIYTHTQREGAGTTTELQGRQLQAVETNSSSPACKNLPHAWGGASQMPLKIQAARCLRERPGSVDSCACVKTQARAAHARDAEQYFMAAVQHLQAGSERVASALERGGGEHARRRAHLHQRRAQSVCDLGGGRACRGAGNFR